MDRDYNQITPWPWKWEFIGTAGNYFLVGNEGKGYICNEGPNTADGKLMQAAPELLAALKILLDDLDTIKVSDDPFILPAIADARAVIAKAEGGK